MSDYFLSLVSIQIIWSLPWLIKGPAFAMGGYFAIRSINSALTFRPIQTVTSLIWVPCLAIFLSHYGHRLAGIIL